MRKLRLRKGTGPCSRSQGTFPAEAGLEARLSPDGNTLLSTHPAGSHPWPPTTGSSLSRSCIPDGPPPSAPPPPPSSRGAQGTQPHFLGLREAKKNQENEAFSGKTPIYTRKQLWGMWRSRHSWLAPSGGREGGGIYFFCLLVCIVQ